MEQWTIASVKEHLPNVRLRVAPRKIVSARLSGRLNQFATVSLTNDKPRAGVPIFADWHFAWETIVRSLNTGKPLAL